VPRLTAIIRLFIIAILFAFIGSGGTAWAQDSQGDRTGYGELADVLEDDSARQGLIDRLRELAAEQDGEAAADEQSEAPVSLARQVANFTQALAEGAVTESLTAYGAAGQAWESLTTADPMQVGTEATFFAALIAATLAIYWLLGRIAAVAFRAIDTFALNGHSALLYVRRILAIVGAIAVHLLAITLSWAAGYGIALFALGEPGEMLLQESLFLNAFLAVELIRAVIRTLFSNKYHGLRLLPISDENATYWNAWLSRLVYFVGYGLLLVVPILNQFVTPDLGRIVGILILFMAFLKASVIVMQNRDRVRQSLEKTGERMQTSFGRVCMGFAGRLWHFVALAYFGAILLTALIYPEQALPFMAAATAQTLIAAALGIGLSALLSGVILRRIQLPDDTRRKFPLLEARLNNYIPTTLKVTRFAILAIVVLAVLDAWSIFDMSSWLVSDAGAGTLGKVVSVLIILALAITTWLLVASWIEYKLNPESGDGEPTARVKTLLTIFRNAIAIALVIMTTMILLAEIGVNIGPLLAGAGVLGLAIGFGAQKLVQDVITGVFIQLEGAINVGDLVSAGGTTATVEKMTIRSLGLRDLSGTYHLVPFSSVDTVSNYMRDYAYHVGEYGVAYRENTDEVIVRLREAFDELKNHPEHGKSILTDELEVHGVTSLADSSVNIRVRIKTIPGMQFSLGREYNRLVKLHFDAAGIEIPFPHTTIYFGEDKDGKAPPANLRVLRRPALPKKTDDDIDPEKAKANPKFKGDFDEEH